MLTEQENQRLYITIIDKVGGILKQKVWPSQELDGVGYLFAVMKEAVEPEPREWSVRANKFYQIPEVLPSQSKYLSTAFKDWLKEATEVMYSTRFTPATVMQNLGEFLRHYPAILATVYDTWDASHEDYSSLEGILVMLMQEVEETNIRMEKASKYKWGGHELEEKDKVEGKGKEEKAKRIALTDDEREEWKKRHPGECWNFFEKGTCHFGKHCHFKHSTPSRRGSEDSRTTPITEVKPKEGHVRLVTDEAEEEESETEEEYDIEQIRQESLELEKQIKGFYETHPNDLRKEEIEQIRKDNIELGKKIKKVRG